VYFLEELELAIQYQGTQGPNVYADASDLGAIGSEGLVNEVLDGFGLSRSAVTWIAGHTAQTAAAALAAEILIAKQARQSAEST
jgi:hypothetical protein